MDEFSFVTNLNLLKRYFRQKLSRKTGVCLCYPTGLVPVVLKIGLKLCVC